MGLLGGRRAAMLAGAVALLVGAACAPKSEEERLVEAQRLMSERNVLGAMIAYQDFLKKFPESENRVHAQFGLAGCYFANREYEKVREILDEVLAEGGGAGTIPGFNAIMMKAASFEEQRRPGEALDALIATSDTLRMAPPALRDRFQARLGELFMVTGRDGPALETFHAMLGITPQSNEHYLLHMDVLRRVAAIHMRAGRPEAAVEEFSAYLEAYPGSELDMEIHKSIGLILRREGREEEAAAHFRTTEELLDARLEKAVGANEKSVLMMAKADLFNHMRRREEAKALYRHIIDEYPLGQHRSTAMRLLAEVLHEEGDSESALNTLSQIVATWPQTGAAESAARRISQIRAARAQDAATTGSATAAPLFEAALTSPTAEEAAPR